LSFGTEQDFEPLARDVAAGVPAGVALARFEQTEAVRAGRIRACLLGDPRVRLPAPPTPPGIDPVLSDSEWPTPPVAASTFLGLLFSSAEDSSPDDQTRARFASARRACDTDDPDGLSPAARRLCLEALASVGSMPSKLWVPFARPLGRATGRDGRCRACGQQTLVLGTEIPVRRVTPRALTICANCGVVDDRGPDAPALQLDLCGTELHVSGPLTGAWSAGIRLEAFGKEETAWLPWADTDPSGRLAPRDLATHLPVGHSFVSAFLLSAAGELRVLTRRVPLKTRRRGGGAAATAPTEGQGHRARCSLLLAAGFPRSLPAALLLGAAFTRCHALLLLRAGLLLGGFRAGLLGAAGRPAA